MLTLAILKEKVSFNTKFVMLRCFMKEIISINVLFLMYWMLPFSTRIATENFTLPLKYLNKTYIHFLSLSMAILTTLLNKLKLLRNLQKQFFFLTWLKHILWINMKINIIFVNCNSYSIMT